MKFEENIIKIAERALDLSKRVSAIQEKRKILLELANITVTDIGNVDNPTIYAHKDFPEIEFTKDDDSGIYPYLAKGDYEPLENHKEMEKLKKICSFLNIYEGFVSDNFNKLIIDETDKVAGELIRFSYTNEVYYTVKLFMYELTIPYYVDKIEDIDVYKIDEKYIHIVDFWEKNLKKIEVKDK